MTPTTVVLYLLAGLFCLGMCVADEDGSIEIGFIIILVWPIAIPILAGCMFKRFIEFAVARIDK